MKTITFFGSGREKENITIPAPEINSVVALVSRYYRRVLFGGTNIGFMGEFAESCVSHNMEVESVLPGWFIEKHPELIFKKAKEVIVDSLSERKRYLSNTDAVLCYPGGVGTLDELFDIIARISLGEIAVVPIFLYNHERFYSPLLLQIEYGVKTGIIKVETQSFIHTFEHVDQLEVLLKKENL
ncbi:MAG TPA: LOG family protein [Bacteroidota bacterium]|nr:LOG family protein [Bacteroidota bacterium]